MTGRHDPLPDDGLFLASLSNAMASPAEVPWTAGTADAETMDIDQLIDELQQEQEQFEAFLAGVAVGAEIRDGGVSRAEFNDHVRSEWRAYLDEE